MKKVTMWFLTVITLAMGVCMLTACGSPTGKYYLESLKVLQRYQAESGDTETPSEARPLDLADYQVGDEYLGETLEKGFCILELKEDGTFTMDIKGEAQISGTWESLTVDTSDTWGFFQKNQFSSWFSSKIEYVKLSFGDTTIEFERDGNRLKMTSSSYKDMWLVLKR